MTPSAALASKRLVIFGCGYVGSAVARQAVADGLRTTALTRNPGKAATLRAAGLDVVMADLASERWHDAIAPDADLVLNCVGSGGGGVEGYRHSYLEGMRSMLAWARRGPAGTLVYTGSTSVYPQSGGVTVDETAPTGGVGERTKILIEAEALLRASGLGGASAAGSNAARWFILRLAGIYGPGRHHLVDQLRVGELPGGGGHRLNLIHLDDICSAVWAVFAAPASVRGEIFNLADDGAAAKSEIVRWLAARLGQPVPPLGENAARPRRTPEGTALDRIISNAKAKRLLGWRPRFPDFRAGYEAILNA